MIIQHNIMALNSNNRLAGNNTQVAKNLEKLSSGYKINRAGDDAAGLAISEKMRAQITGLTRASQNAQDGVSLVQTAEGQLTEVHSMLNRMVDLATQSSNGTYEGNVDRKNLQKEVQALKDEINRIAETSNFNGIKLLDGSLGGGKASYDLELGAAGLGGSSAAVNFTGMDSNVKSFVVDIVDGISEAEVAAFDEVTGELKITVTRDIANTAGKLTGQELKDALDKLDMGIGVSALGDILSAADLDANGAKKFTFNSSTFEKVEPAYGTYSETVAGKEVKLTANIAGAKGNAAFAFAASANGEVGVTVNQGSGAVSVSLLNTKEYTAEDLNNMMKKAGADYTVSFSGTLTGAQLTGLNGDSTVGGAGLPGGGLNLQIGDTADQRVAVEIGNMSTASLGLGTVDVSTETAASASIQTIKDAINSVSGTRADLGAVQNRLEHTINNLTTTTENMTAAESRIRDTNMAQEMMQFTKNNVLAQAAQAMLAQANQQPQQVLQLLR